MQPGIIVSVGGAGSGGGGGSGDVTAAANFGTDNRLIRSNGITKGVQATGWSVADTDEMSVTVDGVEEEGINVTASGADAYGIIGTASGLAGTGVYGANSTAAGFGVQGVSSVSGGVGVRAWANHAGATALQVGNSGGFFANITFAGTSNHAVSLPDAAGTVALQQLVTKSTATNYTVGTTDPRELYGGIIYVTAACTITVPAVVAGMHFTVITIGAVAVSIDLDGADKFYLDGTALADGDKITNLSTAGDIAAISYLDATGFYASTNGWTDGN